MSPLFVDEVRAHMRGGDGGAGALSFHRSKHMPRGGPDGGDGGSGGSVVLTATEELGSLAPYVRRRVLGAASGEKAAGNNRAGADGRDLVVPVPVGTIVRDATTQEVLADLARAGASFTVARGGRGGRGNAALRTKHDRLPNYAEPGEPGEQIEVVLELHLVADVGLLGPPNAGKSTLLSVISRADPKIGDYPFTTLVPGLGVVDSGDERFVVADLPGLIEGASVGRGLGLRFLRHAERCSVLAIVVDLAGPVTSDLETVLNELEGYDPGLVDRARVVVGNKTDLGDADVTSASAWASEHGARFVPIAAALGDNVEELLVVLTEEVAKARAERGEPETFAVFRPVAEDRIVVTREGDGFRVSSRRAERVVEQTSFDSPRSVRRLQQRLRSLGVESALRKHGAEEGDEIRIGDAVFDYVPDDEGSSGRRKHA